MTDAAAPNVDAAEVARFDAMAAQWWDPDGECRPLHDLNPTRLAFIADRVPLDGARVVDVGCGGGLLSEAMARAGADTLGIDMAAGAISVARLHALEGGVGVRYERTTAEALAAQQAGQFDLVTCLEMLEHVPDVAAVVQACATLLKPGGHLMLSTINRTPAAYGLAVLGAEYVLRLLPRGTHDYARFLKPAELSSHVRAAGLTVREIAGLHYNPFSRTSTVGGHVEVNYLLHAQAPQ